ncbi:zinc-binding alcohol dehydrogenase family protein [Paenibacillus mucilaginosus]|uniref:Alcohol dehydrogenase GroES domain-containing protein n=3 Tax=Paenibacillus mucilaginosus TaxID=61624 RepID=H6NI49_9BACL|nr:zinc-binding alcohol dehydrogenase family protein [Paenibacillus mucilaginosus]AEI43155.1 Alcohol dehydrogenase GroES domain protein [Paenibacillus mucilaginosus KNP414]AFC30820.1 alcohol dehydrogenase GroES domain-containing protein [Paenibacillus mucilaginosus 3016]AFH63142.2 alcohol dehydrogenase [Paenibacillus mucilaginosus K02]MCG7212280.1 zinc-binding alcohol dehydrogenase family protein [Paenibacillus mucilaginosus]WDM24759.1 zinc-binding alcohol dehydrogenase family protein [Paeniba
MKCIVCEEPKRLVMKDAGMPPAPAPGEALIRILRIGICGTDLHAYQGNQPFFTYPRVLGHELAAEIVELGEAQDGLAPGDLVSVIPYVHCGSCIACRRGKTNCCTGMSVLGVHQDGGMREFMTVPVRQLVRADGLTPDQAAVVECFSIGAHAVRVGEIRPGDTVLVIGAGPIGLGTMKFAKQAGARVIAMDLNEERLAFCRRWAPADETVHAGRDPLQEVERLTGGDFPVVVLDATGNARSMEGALNFVAHGGRLVYVGLVKADITFHDPDFHKREMAIMGSRNALREDFEEVIRGLRSGAIDTDAFITHRTDFQGMIDQYDSWLRPENGVIKAMVEL